MTALRVVANRETSCVPEAESALQEEQCLASRAETRPSSVPLTSSLEGRARMTGSGPLELKHSAISECP